MKNTLSREKVIEMGMNAALNVDIEPEKAVEIVKAMFASAALYNGKVDVQVSIDVRKDLSERMDVPKVCFVTGQVCVPPFGCHCVCIVPPAPHC